MTEAPSPDHLLAQAWAAYDQGDLLAADRLAQAAATAWPDRWEPLAARVWFDLAAGALEAAEARLTPALAAYPDAWPLWWYAGLLHERRGDLPAAAEALRRACLGSPDLHAAAFTLAWVLHDLGALTEALAWSQFALAAAPDDDRRRQCAWLLLQTGAAAEAAEVYRDLLARLPPDAPDLILLRNHFATALERSGAGRAAETVRQETLAAAPDDPETLAEYAWMLLRDHRPLAAAPLADRLCALAPDRAEGWHLRGLIAEADGDTETAAAAYAAALQIDPRLTDLQVRLAHTQIARGDWVAAEPLLRRALAEGAEVEPLLLQGLLETRQTDEARQRLHRRLQETPWIADLWRLLAVALDQRGRPATGFYACQRATRRDPLNVEAFRLLGWLAHQIGRRAEAVAAVRRVVALTGADPVASAQAAFLLEAGIDLGAASLAEAETFAERAVALAPRMAEAWRALGRVRARQARWSDAETALQTACDLTDQPGDALRQWAEVLLAQGKGADATALLRDWLARAPDDLAARGLLADGLLRAGAFDEGLAVLAPLLDLPPHLQRLRAALWAERGERGDSAAALIAARGLLLRGAGGADVLTRLVALGVEAAAAALELLPGPERRDAYQLAIRISVYRYGHAAFRRLIGRATEAFPDESWFALAAFFADGLAAAPQPADRSRVARRWFRAAQQRIGLATPPIAPPVADGRVRIAYLAAYFHGSLLRRVLEAHDPARVAVYVYTDAPLPPDLPGVVAVPLTGTDLAHSFAANRIDVAIDTVSPHAFEGQDRIVEALVRRLAPVQIAWLGTWATGGGLYDALLTDSVAVPPDAELLYDEEILRIPGGQWAWEPPALVQSPPAGSPPSDHSGRVTFASTVRGMRLSATTLTAWAEILAKVPNSQLWIIGYQVSDGDFRRAFAAQLAAAGVAAERVVYHPPCAYRRLLELYQQVDLYLDAIPANGGLCLLDPLWMGVPFVTCAGPWASDRQGVSILASLDLQALCAPDAAGFVALAVDLAQDRARRARLRRSLREVVQAAPLTDGVRIARFIETEAARLRKAAPPDVPTRAAAAYRRWRQKGGRLDLTPTAAPVVSILLPPEAEPGLLWESLRALVDGSDLALEVVAPPGAAGLPGVHGIRFGTPQAAYRFSLAPGVLLAAGALAAAVAQLDADPALGAITGRLIGADGRLLAAGGIDAGGLVGGVPSPRPYGFGGDPQGPEARFERFAAPSSPDLLLTRVGSTGAILYLPALTAQDMRRDSRKPPPLGDARRDLIDRWQAAAGPRVLILDDAVPLLTAGAGLPRARLILQALAGHAVTHYPLWQAEADWREVYRAVPASTEVILGLGFAGLEDFLAARRGVYQVLLVSRPPNQRRLRALRARRPDLFEGMRLIYDAEAIFAERDIARAACLGQPIPPDQAAAMVADELALAEGCDRVLTVSERDAAQFRAAGQAEVAVLCHAAIPRRAVPGGAKRQGLLFVGALDPGSPNEDSLLWFAEAILPRVPGVTLTVVGTCRSAKVAALAGERLRIVGPQTELAPFYDAARLFIAPTRFAAGVPAKVIEAAAQGVPVVATPLLADQLTWQAGVEIAIGASDTAFASALQHLLIDDDAWGRQQAAAWARVASDYAPDQFATILRHALTAACAPG